VSMFEILVQPDGLDSFELSAGLRDIRLWEKTHAKRSMGQLQDGAAISATILFEVAYSACRRQGLIPDITEDVFCESYEIEVETPEEKRARLAAEGFRDQVRAEQAASLDPTLAAASAAAS